MNPVLLFIIASVVIPILSEIAQWASSKYMVWAVNEVARPTQKPLNPRIKISKVGVPYIPIDDLVKTRLERLKKDKNGN